MWCKVDDRKFCCYYCKFGCFGVYDMWQLGGKDQYGKGIYKVGVD